MKGNFNFAILKHVSYSWQQLIHVADMWFMSLQKLNKEYDTVLGYFWILEINLKMEKKQ